MSTVTVQVRHKIVGGNPSLPALEGIAVRLEDAKLTVEDLIRRTVEDQVWDLLHWRRMKAEEAERLLKRHLYSEEEIARGMSEGAIRYPSERKTRVRSMDPEPEVQKAIGAFVAGAYVIFLNGRQLSRLDEEITLSETSAVTFLRLTPLVGG